MQGYGRAIICFNTFFWSVCLFAGQSLDLNTRISTLTPGAQYTVAPQLNSVGNFRLEGRVRFYGLNTASTEYQQTFETGVCNLTRLGTGASADSLLVGCRSGNGDQLYRELHGVMKPGNSEILFRVQRDATNSRMAVEIWHADGSSQVSPAIVAFDPAPVNPAGNGSVKYVGGVSDPKAFGCSCELAWIRWYNDIVPYPGINLPANAIAANPPSLVARWEFEGDGNDQGPYRMTITKQVGRDFRYTGTPVLNPLVSASVANAPDGTLALNGSATVFSDVPATPAYRWSQVSGPTDALIVSALSPATSADGVVSGTYVFRLDVTDASSRTGSTAVSWNFMPRDENGFPVYPSNTVTFPVVPLNTAISAVAGATKIRVTVLRPDGQTTTTICSADPCSVSYDPRMGKNVVTLEYLSNSGAVLLATKALVGAKQANPPAAVPSGYAKMSIFNYGPVTSDIVRFMSDRYDLIVAGPINPRIWNPNVIWVGYRDFSYLHEWDMSAVRDFADANGYNYEDFYTHMSVDYSSGYPWNSYINNCGDFQWFDTFDRDGKGALLNESGKWTDVTLASWDYNGYCGNPANRDQTFAINDTLYLGYGVPFDRVNFIFTVPAGAGLTTTWQYWNGSVWTSLPLVSNTLNGLRTNGMMRFYPPANWAETSVNGSRRKWWIRLVVTGNGTRPVASRVVGDDWVGANGKLHRGWDAGACAASCINKGTALEYNPNPPANATALFRHQSRMTGLWASGGSFGNPTKIVRGVRIWKEFLKSSAIDFIDGGHNGIMYDDGIAEPAPALDVDFRNYADINGDWTAAQTAAFAELVSEVSAVRPQAFIGANSAHWPQVSRGRFGVQELATSSNRGEGLKVFTGYPQAPAPHTSVPTEMSYESLKPENNPGGTVGVMQIWDPGGEDGGNDTCACGGGGDGWYYWDRQNRGPLAALSMHLIAANLNTRFGFDTSGWYYPDSDQVYLYGLSEGTLSTPVPPNDTYASKTITGNFAAIPNGFSGLVSIGDAPDGAGEDIAVAKINDNTLITTSRIYHFWGSGTRVRYVYPAHLSQERPPLDRVHHWNNWFPAASIDFGEPVEEGQLNWMGLAKASRNAYSDIDVQAYGGRIWKREFTRALVLHRTASYATQAQMFEETSTAIDLGGTWYPLKADGTTGDGITQIRLRFAEGAILMKEPVQ